MRLTRYFAPKVIGVVSLTLIAFGQPQPQQEDGFDPDSANRGVARISVMNGDVSVRRGDSGDFVAAAINAPLVVGDSLLTGPNSVAEVQFDWANMIRIAPDTEIRLAELADRRYQIQVARGMATFRVLRPSDADVEVSTPQVSMRPRKEGVYRLLVRDDNESEVTVRSGEVEIFTPQGVETLRAGRTMQVRGVASDPEYQIISAVGEDEWDRWNRNRDQDLERSSSYRYVNRDVYGADDLDNYGQWVSDPDYGNVWSPRVAAGWAPYREGRWVWIDWYGWSWVSYDPWGWAPYHYGRWYQSASHGWCWYPGGIGGRRSWSPGLVAFVGFGGGGGIGVGFSNIGWVPLAPHERYNRWYGRGFYGGNRGFSNVTVTNNVNLYSSYRNARVNNAVSAMDAGRFGRGGSGRAWRSSDGDIQRASLVRGQLPVAPGRESLRLTDRDVRGGISSRSPANQRFVSRRQPTQVERVPFEQQRRNFEQGGLRNADTSRANGSGFNQPSQSIGGGNRDQQQPSGSWRRFGDPSTGTADRLNRPAVRSQPSSGEASAQRGWSGFGQPGATVDRNPSRTQPYRQEAQPAVQPQPERSARPVNDNWRRFDGQTSPGPSAPPARTESAPRYDRNNAGRPERQMNPAPSREYRSAPPEPARISPPPARERSMQRQESAPPPRQSQRSEAPRSNGGNGNGNGNGGGGDRPANNGGNRNDRGDSHDGGRRR